MRELSRPGPARWAAAVVAVLAMLVLGLLVLGLSAGCQGGDSATAKPTGPKIKPAKVEPVSADVKRVTLTEDAARRLDVQTTPIREAPVAGQPRKVIPYAAVIYDRKGEPWTITNPQPLTYVREKIVIQYIEGDSAVLADGPPFGTAVVTVGAAEVYGTELGIG